MEECLLIMAQEFEAYSLIISGWRKIQTISRQNSKHYYFMVTRNYYETLSDTLHSLTIFLIKCI